MSDRSRIAQSWLALVNSGNIRYASWPAAGKAIADDGLWDEVVVAGAGPGGVVPAWLCGFTFSVPTGTITAEVGFEFSVGYGGVAGDGNAPAAGCTVITLWHVAFSAVALALGPFSIPPQMLPYPVRLPVGVSMEAMYTTLVGASAINAFRVILATAVGS